MARRPPTLLMAALGLAAALPACKDTPSFRLRWDLQGRLDPTLDPVPPLSEEPALPEFEPVSRAVQCSQVGVTAVRVRAIDEKGFIASDDVYPCFAADFEDPEGMVEGPQLRPGAYALEVRGVQRDLGSWIDRDLFEAAFDADGEYLGETICEPGAHALGCLSYDLVCDCQEFTAVEDETFGGFDRFRLVAPGDCIDGIDNDRDGLLDVEDPGCSDRPLQELISGDCTNGVDDDHDGRTDELDADCYIHEGGDVEIVQFTLVPTVLDENPAATCGGVGITGFLVTAGVPGGEAFEVARASCDLGSRSFFATELPAVGESLAIAVTALHGGEAITAPVDADVMVSPGSNAIVDLVVDFGEESFEPPLVKATTFSVAYRMHPDAEDLRGSCMAEPTVGGTLAIDSWSLDFRDLAGAPVPGATLGGAPLDGTPIACRSAAVSTNALPWGGYTVSGEALAADGTVCFRSADAVELAPSEGNGGPTLVLERVLVEGVPPPSCSDCAQDLDCGDGQSCVDGVCL
ncbi:MAG TPA: hypothetical protein VFG69_18135 [Nannocystaceae bacterium]|nr:hypothetical protein [Nannocystaceae bacterium]